MFSRYVSGVCHYVSLEACLAEQGNPAEYLLSKILNITQLQMRFSHHSDEVERQMRGVLKIPWHFQQLLLFDKNCQTNRLEAIRL